jgi:hypothetical protein
MIQVETETRPLWSTPSVSLFLKNSEPLNKALERIVLQEERRIVSKKKSIPVAGLESGLTTHWLEYNVLNWQYPEIIEFRKYIIMGINKFCAIMGGSEDHRYKISGISCWANVLRTGQALQIHHHDPAFISAHYTVKTGMEDEEPGTPALNDSGHTVYFRPGFMDRSQGGQAAAMPSPWDEDWRLSTRPVAGKLFFFPSYVRHEVRPYLGTTYRISIAMDVFLNMQNYPINFNNPRWFIPK